MQKNVSLQNWNHQIYVYVLLESMKIERETRIMNEECMIFLTRSLIVVVRSPDLLRNQKRLLLIFKPLNLRP